MQSSYPEFVKSLEGTELAYYATVTLNQVHLITAKARLVSLREVMAELSDIINKSGQQSFFGGMIYPNLDVIYYQVAYAGFSNRNASRDFEVYVKEKEKDKYEATNMFKREMLPHMTDAQLTFLGVNQVSGHYEMTHPPVEPAELVAFRQKQLAEAAQRYRIGTKWHA